MHQYTMREVLEASRKYQIPPSDIIRDIGYLPHLRHEAVIIDEGEEIPLPQVVDLRDEIKELLETPYDRLETDDPYQRVVTATNELLENPHWERYVGEYLPEPDPEPPEPESFDEAFENLYGAVSQIGTNMHRYAHRHAERLRAAMLGRPIREPSFHKVQHEVIMKCEKEIRMEFD